MVSSPSPTGVVPISQAVDTPKEPTTAPTPLVASSEAPTSVSTPAPADPPTQTSQPSVAASTPSATPAEARTSERVGGPIGVPNNHKGPHWVTLQAGHWRNENLPEELQHLTTHTGAYSNGVSEVDVNVAVANLAAKRLFERGYSVDILDATVPISYTTDLFLALHADGSSLSSWRGFKAVSPWGAVPSSEDFVSILYEEYGKATGLPTDAVTSVAMADYYAFDPERKYRHDIAPGVPSALLEMGFVTNPDDRKVLTTEQDRLAWGIANAVDRWFRSGAAGNTPTPYPTFTPSPTATRTATPTSTVTPTPTATATSTTTPIPTEQAIAATETAALVTPAPPTATPRLPKPTNTPLPTPTPLTGTITTDGRWLPPRAPNGRTLPAPGSDAPPVLLSDAAQDLPLTADGRERQQIWQQFYMPELGRSVWKEGQMRYVRH